MLKMFRGRDRRSQGGVSHNDVQIFKHLEEADVDTLIDELAVLTDNAADGNVDLDKINAYLDALDEKDPIPFGVSAEDSLAKFHARHDLLTKELSNSHQKRSKSKRIATKIAASFAVLCNVKWAALNNTTSQQWKITTVTTTTGDYITAGVGGWLKLYKKPTSSKTGRTVTIPTVASYTGIDGYTYKFTNKNYWYAYENPYKNKLNKYAIDRIKEVTGANPIVNVGSNGEYTDENGNYWMAVGPKVPNPSQASNANISAEQVYALGKLDVVVKSSNGTLYYIPGVIGDIKAHTWNNGVIQTYKAYPDGKFASAGRNFNGTVCAEFIGDLDGKLTGLGSYSVEKIIFYAD